MGLDDVGDAFLVNIESDIVVVVHLLPPGSNLSRQGRLAPIVSHQEDFFISTLCTETGYDFLLDVAAQNAERKWEERFQAEHFSKLYYLNINNMQRNSKFDPFPSAIIRLGSGKTNEHRPEQESVRPVRSPSFAATPQWLRSGRGSARKPLCRDVG